MVNEYFPRLKKTSRIKKYPSYCWAIDLLADAGKHLSGIEAFVLSLCTGELSESDLNYIFAQTFRLNEEASFKTLRLFLKKTAPFLEMLSSPEPGDSRYDPESFIYDTDLSDENLSKRMETPAEMTFVITNKGNFRCVYCYNSSGDKQEKEMGTAQWLEVIRQAKELGVMKCTLTGGEPMLHPGFFDILDSLCKNDIMPYVCTNGSFLNDKAVKLFIETGAPLVQISLDAPTCDTHDKLTAVDGTFPRVRHAIEAMANAGVNVYVKAVVMPLNAGEVGDLIDLCYNLGVKVLILDQYDLSYAGRGSNSFFMSREQNEQVKAVVEEKRAAIGSHIHINLIQVPRC